MKVGIVESKKYNPVSIEPNTFIGNVSGDINSAAILASLLNILETDISGFEISGFNVAAQINVNYIIPVNAFRYTNRNITYYLDIGGKVTETGGASFLGCLSLRKIYFPALTLLGVETVSHCNNLRAVIIPECLTIGNNNIYDSGNVSGEKKYLRKITIYAPKTTALGSTVGNNSVFAYITINSKIYSNSYLQTVNSGGLDGDLVQANTNGAQIFYDVFKDVTETPNSVTNISMNVIYDTAVELGFDHIAGTNDLSRYSLKNSLTGEEISSCYATEPKKIFKGLQPDTLYSVVLNVADEFENISPDSISFQFTTTTKELSPFPLSGIEAIFTFNEATSIVNDSWNDKRILSLKGTKMGTVDILGKFDQALRFPTHIYPYVNLTELRKYFIGSFSFNIWINFRETGRYGSLMGTRAGGSASLTGFRLVKSWSQFVNQNGVDLGVGTGSWSTEDIYEMLTIVFDNENGTLTSYKNGVQVIQRIDSRLIGSDFRGQANYFYLGMQESFANSADMDIDQFILYKSVLTQAQITNLFNNGNGITL